jgi:hypothetical protein
MLKTAKHIPLILLSLLVLLSACSGKKEVIESYNTTKDIEIDGSLADWPHDKAMVQSDQVFDYYITNDDHYLYFFVSFKSPFYHNAAENVGFTLYIDNNPDNQRSFGITYPLGVTNAMREIPGVLEEYTDDTEWMKEKQHQELWETLKKSVYDKVMLTRKLGEKDNPQHLILPLKQVNAQGVKIARNTESRKLQLEFRVPIVSTRTEQFAADPRDGKPLHIGFEIQPPDFDLTDEVSNSVANNRRRGGYYGRGGYGGVQRQPNSHELERRMSKQMGEYYQWFWVQL